MSTWKKFWKLPVRDQGIFLESVIYLGTARAMIFMLPFRRIKKIISAPIRHDKNTAPPDAPARVEIVGKMVRAAARHLPWECLCLTQALAGKMMLSRRGIDATVYIGVKKDPTKAILESHAWLKWRDRCITGAKGHENFIVMTDFKSEI